MIDRYFKVDPSNDKMIYYGKYMLGRRVKLVSVVVLTPLKLKTLAI